MQSSHTFKGKVSMDQIYDEPDPRAYLRKLEGLDYILPGVAKYLFQELVSHLQESRDKAIDILDVGCSYGVNAALLKHDMSMTELYAHWGQKQLEDASSEEVLAYDTRFFSCAEQQADIRVLGLDAAENAVAYAEDVGLLDGGLALDLESEALPAENAADLQSVDLIISTGCVGYVTETTFRRLLPAVFQDELPWFANFALRTFPSRRSQVARRVRLCHREGGRKHVQAAPLRLVGGTGGVSRTTGEQGLRYFGQGSKGLLPRPVLSLTPEARSGLHPDGDALPQCVVGERRVYEF